MKSGSFNKIAETLIKDCGKKDAADFVNDETRQVIFFKPGSRPGYTKSGK